MLRQTILARFVATSLKIYGIATNDHYRRMYEALLYGDPKKRVLRITWNNVFRDYRISIEEDAAKEGAAHG